MAIDRIYTSQEAREALRAALAAVVHEVLAEPPETPMHPQRVQWARETAGRLNQAVEEIGYAVLGAPAVLAKAPAPQTITQLELATAIRAILPGWIEAASGVSRRAT